MPLNKETKPYKCKKKKSEASSHVDIIVQQKRFRKFYAWNKPGSADMSQKSITQKLWICK